MASVFQHPIFGRSGEPAFQLPRSPVPLSMIDVVFLLLTFLLLRQFPLAEGLLSMPLAGDAATPVKPPAHTLWVQVTSRDGHIGFNEPGSSFASRTRVKALYKQTIEDNARFFDKEEDVPRFAITMGVGTILEAKKILLIANGEKKADVVAQFIEGPVTSQITATALQLHSFATVVLDQAAASKLTRTEYYNWVRDNKHRIQKMVGR